MNALFLKLKENYVSLSLHVLNNESVPHADQSTFNVTNNLQASQLDLSTNEKLQIETVSSKKETIV